MSSITGGVAVAVRHMTRSAWISLTNRATVLGQLMSEKLV